MRMPGMSSFGFIVFLMIFIKQHYSDEVLYNPHREFPCDSSIAIGPKIPKHLISMVSVWQQLPHPWQYRLWTEKEIDEMGLINRDLYDKADNYAEKSDIARYEILARYGGVYADCDVRFVRPEELRKMHMNYDFYAGLEQLSDQRTFSIGNSIIGCVPNHPVIHNMVKNMHTWNILCRDYYAQEITNGRTIERWEPTCLRTGPGYLSATFYKYGMQDCVHRNIIFPPDTFYPYDFTPDHEDIVARHGYEGSWLKKRYHSLQDFYSWIYEYLLSMFGCYYVPPYYGK